MKPKKVLNLYAGIGGNRKLWGNVEVTAVELNPDIAAVYKEFFPNDQVIVEDAHKYLLDHFDNGWDFIWASPPCPTHSILNHSIFGAGTKRYPDMGLYQEIILLKYMLKNKTKWAIENVKPYYEPLIKPYMAGRHCFWANFNISNMEIKKDIGTSNRGSPIACLKAQKKEKDKINEILGDRKISNKGKLVRNMVDYNLGLHIFNCAFKTKQETLNILTENQE